MNMMTAINPARATTGRYLDEKGLPSERHGPDLTKAESIEDMLAELYGRKTGPHGTYSAVFYSAAKGSGIELVLEVDEAGEESVRFMLPCDSQEDLRRPRYRALNDHLYAKPRRLQHVIELLVILGRFHDARPFASIEEAAEAYAAAGGRIYVHDHYGKISCEETMPTTHWLDLQDSWARYPRKRMLQHYANTLAKPGAREKLIQLVRERGVLNEETGSYTYG
ncbi:hypothetical protein PIB19_02015 [Sphingomonas sp. 7/4-4]|uniref:hypothetical protein n=1 Tax=Sphingomonas sp. 7/4-4 TaxID=3018446 RepID=UPI0022F3FACC|nr:hypothetical protein [Sphingomonas sp. 7/4-4]WBY08326.1 hypothetical protein PIB19_02015 [Sphingomonas sp. 7/4-4]